MKAKYPGSFLCLLLIFTTGNSIAQTIYTWNKTGTADWTMDVNWTPARTNPAADDILIFNSGAATTPVNIPTQTIGKLSVSNNTIVNLQAAVSTTLIVAGIAGGDDLVVSTGSSLNNTGANAATIFVAGGATASISGNMSFSVADHRLNAADAGGIVFNSPAVFAQDIGCSGNVFTSTGTANAIVFNSGSVFVQYAGANPFGLSQPASKVTFNSGSLFKVKQLFFLSFSGRTYADLEIDFATFNQSVLGLNQLSINNLIITQGTLSLNLTGSINIKGDIVVAAGQTLNFNPASSNTLSFNGTTPQTITNSGTITFNNNEAVVFNNSAGINIHDNITFNNLVTFTSGIVKIADTKMMTLSATASVATVSNTSFTDGMVKKTGNTAFTFPIGRSDGIFTGYVPLKISAPALITDEYIAAYKRSGALLINNNYAAGLDHVSGVDHWILNRTSGTTSVDVTLYWTTQSSSNGSALYINDLSKLVIAHYNGATQWDTYGGTFNTGSGFAAGSITWSGVNAFNTAFSLGSTDASNPLPVNSNDINGYTRNKYTGVNIVGLMPNVINSCTVLHLGSGQKNKITLAVTDVTGRLLQKNEYVLTKGDNYLTLNFTKLPAGLYQLSGYFIQGKTRTVRFIKQ